MRRQDSPLTPLNARTIFEPKTPRRIITNTLNADYYLRNIANHNNTENKLRAVVASKVATKQYLLGSQPAPVHYRVFDMIKRKLDREIRRLRSVTEEYINEN
jgi:hypothetical protein